MQNQNNQTTKTRYPLASAGRRIGAKFLDIIFISIIVLGLGFAIFCTDPNFKWHSELKLAQTWRYGLFVSLVALLFFGLMLLLPRLWKKTLGMKICKLNYYNNLPLSSFTFNIFKHELFIWEIIVFIAFIMGWTLTFLSQNKAWSLIAGANLGSSSIPEGADKVCYYVGTGFSCLYTVAFLFLLAIIVGICIKNKKPAFHDKYSNLLVIYMKPLDQNGANVKPNNKKEEEISNRAPGHISAQSLQEIDKI